MENFELTAFLKTLLFKQVVVHLHAIAKGMLPSFQILCNTFLHGSKFNQTQTNAWLSPTASDPIFTFSYRLAKHKPCMNF